MSFLLSKIPPNTYQPRKNFRIQWAEKAERQRALENHSVWNRAATRKTVSFPNSWLEVLTPSPSKCGFIWKWGQCKGSEFRWDHIGVGWAPDPIDWCPSTKEKFRNTQWERDHVNMKADIRLRWLQATECQRLSKMHWKLRRVGERLLPPRFQKEPTYGHLDLGPLALGLWDNTFLLYKSHVLWYFAMAALGN